jgi:hypothetical protein
MADRTFTGTQSEHDDAVRAARDIYRDHGKHVWIDPDGERNMSWSGLYMDVIAANQPNPTVAWVVEVETADSVTDSEATDQWSAYDQAYTAWYLAVPVESEQDALTLLITHGIQHCTVVTWRRNPNGLHTFWGLPGLS